MEKAEEAFFTLLKSGLWKTPINIEVFHNMSNNIWKSVYNIASKQTVIGIVYDGISQLPKEYRPPKDLLLQWGVSTIKIEKLNELLNKRVAEVTSKYQDQGLMPVLLKGQGIGQYYPNSMHRQPGDIDLYFGGENDYTKANEIAATWDMVKFNPDTSYHRAFDYKDVKVENHRIYAEFYNQRNSRKWNKVKDYVNFLNGEKFSVEGKEIDIPSPQMNAIYIFMHLMHHFLLVGVGLRQVCDWLCELHAKKDEIDKELFGRAINDLPIKRSMAAMKYVAVLYMGFTDGDVIPLDISSKQVMKDGELMIRDILEMGNFGHSTEALKGFSRDNCFLQNMKSYFLAMKRFIRIYPICKSEVIAYPIDWIMRKIKN